MAIGMKIKDFANPPHQTRSASTATNNPKNTLKVGTTTSHIALFPMACSSSGSWTAQW